VIGRLALPKLRPKARIFAAVGRVSELRFRRKSMEDSYKDKVNSDSFSL
jgi:hypothetical protein